MKVQIKVCFSREVPWEQLPVTATAEVGKRSEGIWMATCLAKDALAKDSNAEVRYAFDGGNGHYIDASNYTDTSFG